METFFDIFFPCSIIVLIFFNRRIQKTQDKIIEKQQELIKEMANTIKIFIDNIDRKKTK